MRIISKFSDYYDSIQSFEKDDILYLRKSKELLLYDVTKLSKVQLVSDCYYHPHDAQVFREMVLLGHKEMLVGFCGKLYPLLEIYYQKKINGKCLPEINKIHFYKQIDLNSFILEMGLKTPKRRDGFNQKNEITDPDYFKQMANVITKNQTLLLDFFQKLKVPVFLVRKEPNSLETKEKCCWRETVVVINPRLQDISFQKVLDPFMTFQEISMFIGGVLGVEEKPMLRITDQIKAQQHGFNQHSFKTMKGDKKPRKNNRGKGF